MTTMRLVMIALLCLAAMQAQGQEAGPLGQSGPLQTEAGPVSLAAEVQELKLRMDQLAQDNATLRARVAQKAQPALLSVMDGVRLRLGGYADLGFFKAFGDGVAYVRDVGKADHPDLAGDTPWVFSGDPWANAVNSQGDSADLGLDRTNIARFDPIRSGGRPTFIANLLNLTLQASLGSKLFFESSVNFEPRQGALGSPGDLFDVDLLYLRFVPSARIDLQIYAGKIDSSFGIEYRARKAPERLNVTPSIMARYMIGTPLGLKVRGSVLSGHLGYMVSLTNGSMGSERFGHLSGDTDANHFKTVSGRLSLTHDFGERPALWIEIGGSGLFGAQDLQPDDGVYQWQAGADLKVRLYDLTLRGEYVRVNTDGGGRGSAMRLSAQGG